MALKAPPASFPPVSFLQIAALGAKIGLYAGFTIAFIGTVYAFERQPFIHNGFVQDIFTTLFIAISTGVFGAAYGAAICAAALVAARLFFPRLVAWQNERRLAEYILIGSLTGAAISLIIAEFFDPGDWTPFTYFKFSLPSGPPERFVYLGPKLLILAGAPLGLFAGLLRDSRLIKTAAPPQGRTGADA